MPYVQARRDFAVLLVQSRLADHGFEFHVLLGPARPSLTYVEDHEHVHHEQLHHVHGRAYGRPTK